MADRRENAVATAQAYNQGNIAGLDDAMTRRLVASTAMTESNGGNLTITNKQGYVGRYQAGAGWLADAGYIDKDKLAAAMGSEKSEWRWASQGHMTEFLNDPANWKNGLSLEKYKASPELQDKAFKTNSDNAYHTALKQGVLKEGDDPAKVAGFLKARHIAGYAGAKEAVVGGRVIRDSNGTSNYDYLHDITRNRDGLNQLMGQDVKRQPANPSKAPGAAATGETILKQEAHGQAVSKLQSNLATLGYVDAKGKALGVDGNFGPDTKRAVEAFQHDHHLTVDGKVGPQTQKALDAQVQARAQGHSLRLDNPANPDHALYEQARTAVHALDAHLGRKPDQQSDQLAASLTVAARREGMSRIDTVTLSADGSNAFAVQGAADSPNKQIAHVPTAQAVNTPIEQSSQALAQLAAKPADPTLAAPLAASPSTLAAPLPAM
ncbi:peptidoglycan-binding domain-containing protein [Rhodanobacter sp. L36]|uniref:peptidoglycan-binding domain-containing protein n=1 Tax=Rhodanobacter sp. L36 TaxID=1747221 RepID=UPI00131C2925|nr:peptidoglycan-binding domain-containing protein [Rhodanobacter sp. L36]